MDMDGGFKDDSSGQKALKTAHLYIIQLYFYAVFLFFFFFVYHMTSCSLELQRGTLFV